MGLYLVMLLIVSLIAYRIIWLGWWWVCGLILLTAPFTQRPIFTVMAVLLTLLTRFAMPNPDKLFPADMHTNNYNGEQTHKHRKENCECAEKQ